MRFRTIWCGAALLVCCSAACAQVVALPAFSAMAPGPPALPWRVAGLPGQKTPLTQFEIVTIDGHSDLRVTTNGSYGNLVLDAKGAPLGADALLRWRWRLERGLGTSDLTRKQGDDAPLKVCALFDMPLDGLNLAERTKLRLARSVSGEHLPAATLCYVWDRLLPANTEIANVFSARVRYVVATSGDARPGQWFTLERRLAADFLRAFGHESPRVPPLLAIAVGADADNTGGSSLGYVGDVTLAP